MSGEFTINDIMTALNHIKAGKIDNARKQLDYCEMKGTNSDFCSALFLLAKGFMDYKLKAFHIALNNFNEAYNKFKLCSVEQYSDINYWLCESLIMILKSSIRTDEEPKHFRYLYIDRITEYHSADDKYLTRANFVKKGTIHNLIDDIRYC